MDFNAERRAGIGGSDVAPIFGLSPYRTAYDVWTEKLNLQSESEVADNGPLYWGNNLEQLLVDEYVRKTNTKVSQRNGYFTHKNHVILRGHVDGIIDDGKKILECKTVNAFKKDDWGPEGTDEIPQEYITQCQHYCDVTGIEEVDIAVLFGGNTFAMYHYKSNRKLGDILIKGCVDFWDKFVVTNIAPPNPEKPEPVQSGTKKEATEDILKLISDYKDAKEAAKKIEITEKALRQQLLNFIEGNERLDFFGETLATYKTQTRASLDVAALKKRHPEIHDSLLKISSFNVLRLK